MITATPVRDTATLRLADPGRTWRSRRRRMRAWLFMIPLIAVNLLVIAVPSIEAVYYAFTNWTGYGGAKWIGPFS